MNTILYQKKRRILTSIVILLLGALTGVWAEGNFDLKAQQHYYEQPHEAAGFDDEDTKEDYYPETREIARHRIQWRDNYMPPGADPESWIKVNILAINDFHGYLQTGRRVGNRPVGGAAVLAAYLKTAQLGAEEYSFIVHAGDHVGASPPASALLQDETAIMFMNLLANKYCYDDDHRYNGSRKNHHYRGYRLDPRCNIVTTVGNHEFDEGVNEMLRLIYGGNHINGPFLEDPYSGAAFPYVAANVVDAQSGKLILPPYVIKKINGMPIAFIGAVLKETPSIVTASGVAGVRFLDEAEAINSYIPELRAKHVRSIIVLIHQGGRQTTYQGTTISTGTVTGPIVDIVSRLDDEIDVVITGHVHSFTNAILRNHNGKEILVTQAFSYGTAYADIDLEIDPATKDIVTKSAAIITTYADEWPGLVPDYEAAQLVAAAEAKVAHLVNRVIGVAAVEILKAQNPAGESALGNLIADAQRAAMGTDFAFMNPGGIRADVLSGQVTWGELFTVQPFSNYLIKMDLTGKQIYDLLNQQWINQPYPRILQVSGLTYTWDNSLPVGNRIVEVRKDGIPINPSAVYTITVNSFLAGGGDNFTVLTQGVNQVVGPVDLEALITYIQGLPQPFSAQIDGRIIRFN